MTYKIYSAYNRRDKDLQKINLPITAENWKYSSRNSCIHDVICDSLRDLVKGNMFVFSDRVVYNFKEYIAHVEHQASTRKFLELYDRTRYASTGGYDKKEVLLYIPTFVINTRSSIYQELCGSTKRKEQENNSRRPMFPSRTFAEILRSS